MGSILNEQADVRALDDRLMLAYRDSRPQELIFGDHIPALRGAWQARSAFRLGNGAAVLLLHDEADDRWALWHLDAAGRWNKRLTDQFVEGLLLGASRSLVGGPADIRPFDADAFDHGNRLATILGNDKGLMGVLRDRMRVSFMEAAKTHAADGPDGDLLDECWYYLGRRSVAYPSYLYNLAAEPALWWDPDGQIVESGLEMPLRSDAGRRSKHSLCFDTKLITYTSSWRGEPCLMIMGRRRLCLSGFYFPERQLIVASRNAWSGMEDHLKGVFARMTLGLNAFQAQARSYHAQPIRQHGLMTGDYHIGHYLWNELSGFEHLHRRIGLADIGHVYVCARQPEHYGGIERLYPEFAGNVVRDAVPMNWLRSAFEHQEAINRPTGEHILASLANRITGLAERAEKDFRRQLDGLADEPGSRRLKLVIGLRVENRCWVEQGDGYVALARQLIARGERVAFVFDGHNVGDNDQTISSSGEARDGVSEPASVAIERGIVAQFAAAMAGPIATGQIAMTDTIGMPVSASIVASLWSDYLITHWGAGQAKYKWVANAPSFIFSSRDVLTRKRDVALYDTEEVRSGIVMPDFIDPAVVVDLADSSGGALPAAKSMTSNFVIDPDIFAAQIIARLEARGLLK